MNATWKLKHRPDVGSREASFPKYKNDTGAEEWNISSYVILTSGNDRAILKSSIRQYARGQDVFVATSVLKELKDDAEVQCKVTSAARYRLDLALNDPKQRASLWGSLVALAGVVIDGILAIGKVKPLWIVEESVIIGAMLVSMLLKIVGLALVLWKGVLEAK